MGQEVVAFSGTPFWFFCIVALRPDDSSFLFQVSLGTSFSLFTLIWVMCSDQIMAGVGLAS
jgi:hypothetical protein